MYPAFLCNKNFTSMPYPAASLSRPNYSKRCGQRSGFRSRTKVANIFFSKILFPCKTYVLLLLNQLHIDQRCLYVIGIGTCRHASVCIAGNKEIIQSYRQIGTLAEAYPIFLTSESQSQPRQKFRKPPPKARQTVPSPAYSLSQELLPPPLRHCRPPLQS